MSAFGDNETTGPSSTLRLAVMAFLVIFFPYAFVWFIQGPEYPLLFRRLLTSWAILWCFCALLYLIARPY